MSPSAGRGEAAAHGAPRPMSGSRVHMAQIVMPNDANPHGTISGGRVMHLMDVTAAMAAMRHARSKVVTVAIDEVVFHAPVPIGHIIDLRAQVTCVGKTSMEVKVEVAAEDPLTGRRWHTTTAHLVFVAIDDNGRPRQVPGLVAETDEEKEIVARARARRERRLKHRSEPRPDV